MKQIIDNIWNASPSAILQPLEQVVEIYLTGIILVVVIGSLIFWISWHRFNKKHFDDPFFKR
jgi:hypothetical protein